ncbi:MAG: hypothetical protein DCC58_02410 [Chloroflexi bacterium]|nr:MAG: hypothetical protein DCC58_02410 [Chloroflexota bacterium]
MFAAIAPRYDLLNDLLTARRHRAWKRAAAAQAQPQGMRVLDLGSGTGDIARELLRAGAAQVVAADRVPDMLHLARTRSTEVRDPRQRARLDYVVADALQLPFRDGAFQRVTCGFLIRNVPDVPLALSEMLRVLTPGGTVVCLEATRKDGPAGRVLHAGFSAQARLLGRLAAGAPDAYAYLPDSAAAFYSPAELVALLRSAGFIDVGYRCFGLGLVALHWGTKPS